MATIRIMASVALLVPALAFALVTPAAAQEPPTLQGTIIDFEIQPPELRVTAGDTITWTNTGGRPHTVTDRGGLFDTGPIEPGQQGEATLTAPGTYEIFCRINPSKMNARIVVEPGDAPAAVVRIQALDENREGETKRFDPNELEVPAGTALVLANVGGLPHTLTAVDGSFTTPQVEPGAEQGRFAGSNASVIVTQPGTYEFFCQIHPQAMRGTLVVTGEAVGGQAPPPEVQAPEAQPEAPPAGPTEASIKDFEFDPLEVTAQPGGEVVWQNTGQAPHTVTFDDVELDTGTIEPGTSATLTAPDQPGSYSWFCAIHPSMVGVLVVAPPGGAAEPNPQAVQQAPQASPPAQAAPPAQAQPVAAAGQGGLSGTTLGLIAAGAVVGIALVVAGLKLPRRGRQTE